MEDLWAFNDEALARTIVQSPMAIISGVGHEIDFTIADFCADMRAPTPTAAAELCAQPQAGWLDVLKLMFSRLQIGIGRQWQVSNQRLDLVSSRFSRPSHFVTRQQARLDAHAQNLRHARQSRLERIAARLQGCEASFPKALAAAVQQQKRRLDDAGLHLELLNPQLVLKRGYARLTDEQGRAVTCADNTRTGQALRATLMDGEVDLTVSAPRHI